MPDKTYLSNINERWPIERQVKLLAASVPDWQSVARYKDVLTAKQRKSHNTGLLTERKRLLRPTGRQDGERIYLASMAVFAWPGADLELALAGAWGRNATLVLVDAGTEITPGDKAAALAAFTLSRKRASIQARNEAGAKVSAALRRARADEGCERIKDRWGLPASEWSTAALLAIAGEPGDALSYNTVTARLGGREKAQARYQAAQKRAARRKEKEGG